MSGPNFGDVAVSVTVIMAELRRFPKPVQKSMIGFIAETLLENIPQAGEPHSVPRTPQLSCLNPTPAARGMAAGTPCEDGHKFCAYDNFCLRCGQGYFDALHT
jgi:hypothetical protein